MARCEGLITVVWGDRSCVMEFEQYWLSISVLIRAPCRRSFSRGRTYVYTFVTFSMGARYGTRCLTIS